MTKNGGVFSGFQAVTFLICLLSLLSFPEREAGADGPQGRAVGVVQDLAADIWSIRDELSDSDRRRQQLGRAIKASTNVDLLSRLVLGRHWRSLGAADRDEYRMLFAEVVIGGLAGRLDSLLLELDGPLDQHFAIIGSIATGKNDIIVRSRVLAAGGDALSVDWRLRDLGNEPVIIDLVIEGISLIVSQRAEFAAVIERSRLDGLIEALRHRSRIKSS